MIRRKARRFLALLLAVVIGVSNSSVQLPAAELPVDEVEEITSLESEDISEDTLEENSGEGEILTEDPVSEESSDIGTEDSNPNGEVLEAETGTFISLDALQEFCSTNDNADIRNALSFSGNEIVANANGLILLSCVEGTDAAFEGYTIKLNGLSGNGADLSDKTKLLGQYQFLGLGRSDNPFKGIIKTSDEGTKIAVTLSTPLFNAVDVGNAKLEGITEVDIKTALESTIAFAQSVEGNDDWSSITIKVEANKYTEGQTDTVTYPGACIGTIKQGAVFTLGNMTYMKPADGNTKHPFAAKVNSESGNAGLLCNSLEENASVTVKEVNVSGDVQVTSTSEAAGGLIGCMKTGASVAVNTEGDTLILDGNWTITGKNAGGLIGEATDVTLSLQRVEVNGAKAVSSVTAGSAGGFMGTYHLTSEGAFRTYDGMTAKVKNVTVDATADNSYIGGLFGVLDVSKDFSINGAEVASTVGIPKSDGTYSLKETTSYGGLVGQLYGTSSETALSVLEMTGTVNVTSTVNSEVTYYGGLTGVIGKPGIDNNYKNGTYVTVDGDVSTTCNGGKITKNNHYFGGAVGGMFFDSVLEIKEGKIFKASTSSGSEIKYGGGIVGVAGRGSTLRLAGKTDLSGILSANPAAGQKPNGTTDYRLTSGQIVGAQNAAVIYAAKSWEHIRPNALKEIDDIGNYGSVIRLGKNIGKGSEALGTTGGLSENLIFQDATSHKTKFGTPAALNEDGSIEISSADEFMLLAIAEQTYGDFGIYPSVLQQHILNGTVKKIVLKNDIDLSNTGFSGLQRDFSISYSYTGEFDGENHTITLDIGQIYANTSDGVGNGQIHGHPQVGLFSKASAAIKNVTIAGTIRICEREILDGNKKSLSSMAAGGCVALSMGSTFDNVTTEVKIQCSGKGTDSPIGGLVGWQVENNNPLSINGCKGKADITDNTVSGTNSIGGLIGVYTAGGTININNTELSGSITGGAITDAKYGGLISVIKDESVEMHLGALTVNGQKIKNNASVSSGGFLGYEWNNSTVYFGEKEPASKVVVNGENSLEVTGAANVGGLVYLATGYWQVNGISLEKASIKNGAGDLGLLLYNGRKAGDDIDTELLYLEETSYDAYHIASSDVEVSSSGQFFDEWVVFTCESAETITNNGNSVISIATEAVEGVRKKFDPDENTCTGYQNRTKNGSVEWTANPNARYYYDLDSIREKAPTSDGYVNTPEEAVLWSVWRYCEKVSKKDKSVGDSNIQSYFKTADIAQATFDGNGATIDLTGYSYYPVNVDAASAQIKNCTIVFANKKIESAEAQNGSGLDSLNRTTVGTTTEHTQHYLMHSGLILKYLNTSTDQTEVILSVTDLTLQGTIGKGPDNNGSGAIVCGTIQGSGVGGSHFAKVEMNGVVLDGLMVNRDTKKDEYAPLVINTVGSYGGINAQKISTSNYENVSESKAATSLIGNVGDKNATNISLAFSNGIALNGKKDESIFSHATLLESFQYSGSSSSGYYHFNEGESCTYGKEIDGTKENVDSEGKSEQLLYFDTRNPIKDGEVEKFNTEVYLPYVCQTKVTNSSLDATFHELEVNIKKPNLEDGCGTYDDPYIIREAAQLELVAQYIAGTTTAGWEVNVVIDKSKVTSEEDVNHTKYTYGSSSWTKEPETGGKESYTKDEMCDYLRNAYYKIADTTDALEFDKFIGLGTTTNPFRGVVDGSEKSIKINAANITSGFVNVSYGSVIQNLNITYTGKKTIPDNKAALNSNTVANESYFGGIIGDVKGGDNLISKVSVVYEDGFQLGVQNHLQCVGGFFGIVEGGGVILSDMPQPVGLEEGKIDWGSLSENEHAYVSPLVGRVLDGFVLNEENSGGAFESSAGSDKNYSIGNIPSDTSISMNDSGEITISKPEELLLLSAIINSGACSAGYSMAYKNVSSAYNANSGKVRNADYSHIGDINAENFRSSYFEPSQRDDTESPASTNLPYLEKKYAENNGAFWTLCSASESSTIPKISLNLNISADLDMSLYKNGYRGIGGRYNCTATCKVARTQPQTENQTTNCQFQRNTPVFSGITGNDENGNNHVINVDNKINGYSDDNFVATAAGGLINMLRRKTDTSVTIQGVTVSGSVEVHDFSDQPDSIVYTNAQGRSYTASVGGVIGRYFTEEGSETTNTYLELKNLKADNLTLYSDCAAGGIVGQTGVTTLYAFGSASNQYASGVTYTNCNYSNLNATACMAAGGIVGAACDNARTFAYGQSNSDKIINKIVSNIEGNTGENSSLNVYSSTVDNTGLGGLIGNVGSNVEINKEGEKQLVLDGVNLNLQDSSSQKSRSRTGGGIGFLHHGTTTAYNITVINSTMGNGNEDNLGGIVGCWYSGKTGGVMENIVIKNCELDAVYSVGGVIGYIDSGAKIIRNITVKQTNIVQQSGAGSDRGIALVVGQINGGGIYGENILLNGNRITSTSKSSMKGRIVGASKDVPIQFLGVSVQYGTDKSGNEIDVSTQPPQDIGSYQYSQYSTKTYKNLISYDAFMTNLESGDQLAGEPSVVIQGIGSENKITGDTATPDTIIGFGEVDGIVKKNEDSFVYIGTQKNYQNVDTSKVGSLTSSIVSSYNANQDNQIEPDKDFKVVQIDGNAACLKQYLNAATNGAFDTAVAIQKSGSNVLDVNLKRYCWSKDKQRFEEAPTGTKPTLTYDKADGSFYATAEYDNQKDMFTLVSVTFKTTANNFKRTYHIPVVVRRMLQVDFMATMVSGTVFHDREMETYNTHALASVGEDITGYLTFKYNSNLSGDEATHDWKSYMETGANLLGYYKKSINTGLTELPGGTKITLIDCQQEQRRYYAKVPEETTSSLELFNGGNLTFKNSKGDDYTPVSLAELLEISADKIQNENETGVKWVRLEGAANATVVDTDGCYYRVYDPAKDTAIEVTDCYLLRPTKKVPEENYYVVISIPQAESHMLTLIKSNGVTSGDMTWSNQETGLPTEIHQLHRYKVDENYVNVDTNKSSEISFNYLENYKQELEDIVLNSNESISVNSTEKNMEMQFQLKNKVTFTGSNYEVSDPLFQELRVSLKKSVNSTETDVYFPSDAGAHIDLYAYYEENGNTVYFKVNTDGKLERSTTGEPAVSYDWKAGNDGNMILPFAVKNGDDQYTYIDLSPLREAAKDIGVFYLEAKSDDVTISTSSVITNELIPYRNDENSQDKTTMYFTSALSFKQNGLSYSTLRKSAYGKYGYYLAEKREAILKLDYLDADQLGINPSDNPSSDINALLTLDFSKAEGFNSELSKFEALNNADKVVFEFSLKQKGQDNLESIAYGDVEIRNYHTGSGITGDEKDGSFQIVVEKQNGTYPYYNETSGVFSIPVTFKVNTSVKEYANYRIYASAKLMTGEQSQKIAVNTDKAFITYTYAKINVNGIWSSSTVN